MRAYEGWGRIQVGCGERKCEVDEELRPVKRNQSVRGQTFLRSRWVVRAPRQAPPFSMLPSSPAALRSQAAALSQDGEDKAKFQVGRVLFSLQK